MPSRTGAASRSYAASLLPSSVERSQSPAPLRPSRIPRGSGWATVAGVPAAMSIRPATAIAVTRMGIDTVQRRFGFFFIAVFLSSYESLATVPGSSASAKSWYIESPLRAEEIFLPKASVIPYTVFSSKTIKRDPARSSVLPMAQNVRSNQVESRSPAVEKRCFFSTGASPNTLSWRMKIAEPSLTRISDSVPGMTLRL